MPQTNGLRAAIGFYDKNGKSNSAEYLRILFMAKDQQKVISSDGNSLKSDFFTRDMDAILRRDSPFVYQHDPPTSRQVGGELFSEAIDPKRQVHVMNPSLDITISGVNASRAAGKTLASHPEIQLYTLISKCMSTLIRAGGNLVLVDLCNALIDHLCTQYKDAKIIDGYETKDLAAQIELLKRYGMLVKGLPTEHRVADKQTYRHVNSLKMRAKNLFFMVSGMNYDIYKKSINRKAFDTLTQA